MPTVVQVTAADIAQGVPCDPARCLLVLALNRHLPGLAPWVVNDLSATAANGKWFRLPRYAVMAYCRFDDGQLVEPFSFEAPF